MKNIKLSGGRQRGAALVVSLILLVLVSLLAAGGFIATTAEARGAANWSDRQRALYLAESVLGAGDEAARLLVKSVNVETAVANKGTGFYVRGKTGFAMFPWSEKTFDAHSVEVKNVAGLEGTAGRYAVFFEGMVADDTTNQVASGNGGNASVSKRARFTVYAKAGGQRDGTLVVLSASRQY